MVSSIATLYKKLRLETHENLGWGKIHLPEIELHTTAYWAALEGNDGASRPWAVRHESRDSLMFFVPLTHSFGRHTLVEFRVWIDEIPG